MQDQLVEFKTAVLAKEKEFNIDCDNKFLRGTLKLNGINNPFFLEPLKDIVEAPTQSLLQRWLREVHNIFVSCSYNHILCDGTYYIWYGNMGKNCNSKEGFKTHEKGLEEGLQQALNLIK